MKQPIKKHYIKDHFSDRFLDFYGRFLPDLKKVGSEYKAICPFHDDKDPSLSVNPDNGLFCCFGCHTQGDIFDFYAQKHGFSLNGDFPLVCKGISDEFEINYRYEGKGTGEIEAEYDYIDLDGKLKHQTVRFTGKQFRQRRPDNPGGWIWNLKNIEPIPYRLPEWADKLEVNYTEGEKDADNLAKIGLPSTTTPMGAGKWRDSYKKYFEGKAVNIFTDNDEAGRNHAELVANKLFGTAKSVKIINPPDLNEKEDVSDFISKFPNSDEANERLSLIIDSTPHYQPPKVYSFEDGILDANDFLSCELIVKEKLLDPWLTMFSISLITGERGIGKTWFAMGLLDALTTGASFGPWKVLKTVPCLYLEADMPAQDTQSRFKMLNPESKRKSPLYIYSDAYASSLGLPRANLLDQDWRTKMKTVLLDRDVKVWVVDNLASITSGIDENSKQDWDPINSWFLDLRFAGISTIPLHHTNKKGGQRGTSAREDNIDISILLKKPHNYEPEEGAKFLVEFVKARVSTSDLDKISANQFQLNIDENGPLSWSYGCAKQNNKKAILTYFDEGAKATEIEHILGISKGYVSKIKHWAIKEDYLNQKKKLTPKGVSFVNGKSKKDFRFGKTSGSMDFRSEKGKLSR